MPMSSPSSQWQWRYAKEISCLKIHLLHGSKRIYVIHIKPQYFKLVKKELEELETKNLALLKEGDIIRL